MTKPLAIIGAGLAGLIAAHAFPGVRVMEAAAERPPPHRALLRFRSDAVSRLTGIPFRRVRVHKGIWSDGEFVVPNPRVANLYARKVIGFLAGDRSIWNVDSVDRWVGPETLTEDLMEPIAHRVFFGHPFNFAKDADPARPVISTAPLWLAAEALEAPGYDSAAMIRAPIWVRRFRVKGADAHQTVYFPDEGLDTYRASLTGDLLIVESRAELVVQLGHELAEVCDAFGLALLMLERLDANVQRFGKIVPLPDGPRQRLLARLTIEKGIYSLGRFATWRNVLLDDVVADAEVIRRMLRSGADAAAYHHLRATADEIAR